MNLYVQQYETYIKPPPQGNQLDPCPCWAGTCFQVSLDIPSRGGGRGGGPGGV